AAVAIGVVAVVADLISRDHAVAADLDLLLERADDQGAGGEEGEAEDRATHRSTPFGGSVEEEVLEPHGDLGPSRREGEADGGALVSPREEKAGAGGEGGGA